MDKMPQLNYAIRGMKRLSPPVSRIQRLPITPQILSRMKSVWQGDTSRRDTAMLWAAATMCFFGFLRAGEVVVPSDGGFDESCHLSFGDVRVDSHSSPQFLEVRIKASKTDPFRKGVTVYLGRTDGAICPVAASLAYMVSRGPAAGPFFTFGDGRCLTRERFVKAVRDALQRSGVDSSRYAGHSFRIGAATTAANRGIQDSLIKVLGRWESSAYTLYVRTPRETLCQVAKTLVADKH